MILEDIEYDVKIETPLYSTEDPAKVKECLSNIFPDVEWKKTENKISGKTSELETFKTILENMQIRDTARSYMRRKVTRNKCDFAINKQASCNSKINFSDEVQPLGGIDIRIQSEKINELIEALTDTGE